MTTYINYISQQEREREKKQNKTKQNHIWDMFKK
jgi:hypothetical protein